MRKSVMVGCLALGILAVLAAGQGTGYEISLDGEPVELYGREPVEGETVYVGEGYRIVLGPPGAYRFRLEGKRLLRETAPDRWTLVGVTVGHRQEGEEYVFRNPLAEMTPEEIGGLLTVQISDPAKGLDDQLAHLDPERCLVDLFIFETDDWDRIPRLPSGLRHLQLSLSHVESESRTTVPDLSPLRSLVNLRWFELDSDEMPFDLDLIQVGHSLESLDLGEAKILHPERLAAFTGLRKLEMRQSRIRDLTPLSGHRCLEVIDADRSRVERLPQGELPALRELRVMATEVSGEAVAAFRKANPQCAVRHTWDEIFGDKLAGATQIRVIDGTYRARKNDKLLFAVTDRSEVRLLLGKLRFDNRNSGGCCMCGFGDIALEVLSGDDVLGRIGVKHHFSRFFWDDVFPGEGQLEDESAAFLAAWLAERGFEGAQETRAEDEVFYGPDRRRFRRYEKLLGPRLLRNLCDDWDAERVRVLAEEFLDPIERVLTCFRLLGVDEGSWSLRYGFDRVVIKTLLPGQDKVAVAAALGRLGEDVQALRGAARWLFGEGKITSLAGLEDLARHALASPRRINRQRTMRTLAGIGGAAARNLLQVVAAGQIEPRMLPPEDAPESDWDEAPWLEKEPEAAIPDAELAAKLLAGMED